MMINSMVFPLFLGLQNNFKYRHSNESFLSFSLNFSAPGDFAVLLTSAHSCRSERAKGSASCAKRLFHAVCSFHDSSSSPSFSLQLFQSLFLESAFRVSNKVKNGGLFQTRDSQITHCQYLPFSICIQ